MTLPVMVVTNERDFAADAVINQMHNLGAPVQRLNIEAATTSPADPWSVVPERGPSVVWWRQFESDTLPATLEQADDILVMRAQWRTWLSTLDTSGSRWINPLWAARRAENKVEQLRMAHQLGFDVPPTIVTNDKTIAFKFSEDVGDAVVKTLASAYFAFSNQSFVFTESLDHEALSDGARWFEAPVIVQKRLSGYADVRVVLVGDCAFAAKCAAPGLDWRKTPFEPELWRRCAPPEGLLNCCRRYRSQMQLEYVAFDFMKRDSQWWFLEANQAGEFSFMDRTLDMGIPLAIAEHLVALGERLG